MDHIGGSTLQRQLDSGNVSQKVSAGRVCLLFLIEELVAGHDDGRNGIRHALTKRDVFRGSYIANECAYRHLIREICTRSVDCGRYC